MNNTSDQANKNTHICILAASSMSVLNVFSLLCKWTFMYIQNLHTYLVTNVAKLFRQNSCVSNLKWYDFVSVQLCSSEAFGLIFLSLAVSKLEMKMSIAHTVLHWSKSTKINRRSEFLAFLSATGYTEAK